MNILITGGTGLIGKRLTKFLLQKGMSVRLLSRQADLSAKIPRYKWDINNGKVDSMALDGVDVVIHLAGANVAEGRWTAKQKQKILDSRVESTRLLYDAIEKSEQRPKTFICASGTGYYGFHDFNHVSLEDDQAGTDFLAEVCVKWEAEADRFSELEMRVVKVRTSAVLDKSGGALEKMVLPVKYFVGAALGSGKQHVPWIHWKDWCGAVGHLIENHNLSGAFNLVAPESVTNATLTRLIARAIHRPLILPNVPEFTLSLILGEMSSIVLKGHKISSKKLQDSGYEFEYGSAEEALSELLDQD